MKDQTLLTEHFINPTKRVDKTNFRYLLILLILSPGFIAIGGVLIVQILANKDGLVFGLEPDLLYQPFWIVISIIVGYIFLVLCINRIRDTGKSVLYLFVPIYNIYLLLFEDSVDNNQRMKGM